MSSQPVTLEQLEALLHREMSPLRAEVASLRSELGALRVELASQRSELGAVRREFDGDDGIRVRLAVLDERVDSLRRAVEDATPPEPPPRLPSPPPSADATLSLRLPMSVLRWLLGALIPTGIVSAGGWWVSRATPTEPAPPITEPGPQEPTP